MNSLTQAFSNGIDTSLTLEPTGFVDDAIISITYDETTRKITLTGDVRALWRGNPFEQLFDGWVSPAHDNVNGVYFLSYDGVSISWSTTPWKYSVIQIALVIFGVNDKFAIRELHRLMQHQVHREFHETNGTYRVSGGDFSGYVLNSTTADNRRPLLNACTVADEDNFDTLDAISTRSYTRMYLSGVNTVVYEKDVADVARLSTNQPYYNLFTGGNWTQALMTNGNYSCIWTLALPVTDDTNSKKYRLLFIQGQSQGTLAAMQALTTQSVNLGTLANASPEFIFIQKTIIRFNAGNWTWIQSDPLTGTRSSQTTISITGNFLTMVTTDSTLTGNGTSGTPLGISGTDSNGVTLANTDDTFIDAMIFG